jgi:hypothetical protein
MDGLFEIVYLENGKTKSEVLSQRQVVEFYQDREGLDRIQIVRVVKQGGRLK